MTDLRQMFLAMGVALIFAAIILGSLTLSMMEGGIEIAFAPSSGATQTVPPAPITLRPGEPTPLSYATPTVVETSTCPPPEGWTEYITQGGDTIGGIAEVLGISVEYLRSGNCGLPDIPGPNTRLNVPPPATPTATITASPSPSATPKPSATPRPVTACIPYMPAGWTTYRVRSGDNLYRIGIAFGINWTELTRPNCIFDPNSIRTGEVIYVPNVPTRTLTFTQIPVSTWTPQPPTVTRPIPTASATPTTMPSPTNTETSAPPSATSTVTQTPLPPTPTSTSTKAPPTARPSATEPPPTVAVTLPALPPLPPTTQMPQETPVEE